MICSGEFISKCSLGSIVEEPTLNRKVLIISPYFPPINAPDHQRVRMGLPYFQKLGWEPLILTVRPDCIEGTIDPLLTQTIPENISITQIKALPVKYTRRLGLSNIGWRCLPYLFATGQRILTQQKIDLIYFSTTVFITMGLAPLWFRRFKIPYLLDFQDPWLNDYGKKFGYDQPPGGQLKYGFAQQVAQILEPFTMRKVSHIISVSPAYPKTLIERYSWLKEDQFTVLPFGAPSKDFELLPQLKVKQTIFNSKDGKRHLVYVGRGGSDMNLALRALFLGIKSQRDRHPEYWSTVKLHFVGTSYAYGERATKTVEPIAEEFGVNDLVEEHPNRVPYFEALQLLVESDGILLIGSNNPDYTASKLYPCILARKPILALFNQQSSVVDILKSCQAGQVVAFDSHDSPTDLLPQVTEQLSWLISTPKGYEPETNWLAFKPYTAEEMTRQQCNVFDQVLSNSSLS